MKPVLLQNFKHSDFRGFFTRIFCKKSLKKKINFSVLNINKTFTKKRGTVRGLVYQKKPSEENKLIYCARGSILDISINMNKKSSDFGKVYKNLLNSKQNKILFVPKNHAHGYQVLEDNTEVFYIIDNFYSKKNEVFIDPKSKNIVKFWKIKNIIYKKK